MQTLTKKTIARILLETKHVVVVEDFDLVEHLDKLAQKVSGVSATERRLLNSPFTLCGIKFYPLTVAKSLWFSEKCEQWGVEGTHQEALLFWLLTLPLSDTALDTYSLEKQAQKACKTLSRRLHCTSDEMMEVYAKCIGLTVASATGEGEQENATDYGGMIACMLKEYGGTPEKWLYETPVEMIIALFDQFEKRIIAEDDATRQKSASNGKAIAPRATPSMKAFKEFRDYAQVIREKWSKDGD